ncbi:hypothetical protein SAMN05443429_1116 [Cruoricaptor ignavus]|uniref:Uncharacterized protein n=1 Tax=Cruoricaptor ignavus TaxID=1118202 RepID=A0A1M6H2U2_9FLAO|nr:hypothetical protein SAMN05443429_1116 [Cruoricaptor ignavus]
MSSTLGFNKKLKKRIDKTKEARQGDPLIKRRNNRNNRSLMRLNTYLKLLGENLDYISFLHPFKN